MKNLTEEKERIIKEHMDIIVKTNKEILNTIDLLHN